MDIQELDRYRVLKGKLLRAILRGVRYPFSADFNYVVNLQAW
ncbi:hypothetical protein [Spirosoma endophyticum]|nr:hypothetical protein [Spirosoma endophyticum]